MNSLPKILIIENECLSHSSSNGRTLANLLVGWPKECLAQFCISMRDPNYEICDNYYCVTDYDALYAAILRKKITGGKSAIAENMMAGKPIEKTPFTMVVRNAVWNTDAWLQRSFYTWVDEFNPDMILLMNGDSYFMHRLALNLAKKYNLPMVIFNCEAYYFFDRVIGDKGLLPNLFQWIFIKKYRRYFEQTIGYAAYSVYLNELLERDYTNVFHKPCTTLYTGSEVLFEPKYEISERPRFSYLGNFSFDRHKPLIEIAKALQSVSSDYKLDVYGNLEGFDEAKDAFDSCNAINYCGVVSYEEVIEVIHESDIVFHTECFDKNISYAIYYGFSTKIADSVSSGTNFFVYAPGNLAFMQYLTKKECAWCVDDSCKLEATLSRLLTDKVERMRILNNARLVAESNHNAFKNSERFKDILINCCQQYKSYK